MHPNRRWRASRSRARSPQMHHASYPVFVHRPAVSDWASFRPRLAATPLPFSLPSALRKPGHRTYTDEVTRHARRTRRGKGRPEPKAEGTCKRSLQAVPLTAMLGKGRRREEERRELTDRHRTDAALERQTASELPAGESLWVARETPAQGSRIRRARCAGSR